MEFFFVHFTRDLGREKSFIELDTAKIDSKKLCELEREVNEAIRKAIPMTPRWVEVGSPELKEVGIGMN